MRFLRLMPRRDKVCRSEATFRSQAEMFTSRELSNFLIITRLSALVTYLKLALFDIKRRMAKPTPGNFGWSSWKQTYPPLFTLAAHAKSTSTGKWRWSASINRKSKFKFSARSEFMNVSVVPCQKSTLSGSISADASWFWFSTIDRENKKVDQ